MNSSKSNLEVKAKMSTTGADRAGLIVSIAALTASIGMSVAAILWSLSAIRWW